MDLLLFPNNSDLKENVLLHLTGFFLLFDWGEYWHTPLAIVWAAYESKVVTWEG